jgi:hypothetical protein
MTAVLAASTADTVAHWGAAGLMVALVAVPLLLFFGALISVLGSRLSGGMKLVWVVFAFCAPFLGPVLWFLVGRKSQSLA